MTYYRTDSDFLSRGTRCAGWLYLPEGVTEPPVVIMAHGFAAERTFRLPAYAEVVRVPLGHFDVYVGDAFEETAKLEADFLERHLLGKEKTERKDPPET